MTDWSPVWRCPELESALKALTRPAGRKAGVEDVTRHFPGCLRTHASCGGACTIQEGVKERKKWTQVTTTAILEKKF